MKILSIFYLAMLLAAGARAGTGSLATPRLVAGSPTPAIRTAEYGAERRETKTRPTAAHSVQPSLTESLAVGATPATVAVPVSQTALAGTNPYFTIVEPGATGFQWSNASGPILSATTATLRFPSVQFTDAGIYTVVATGTAGTIATQHATLTVVSAFVSSPPALPNIPQTVFLASTYGAIGDGATDNTVAIQAAINAAKAAHGGIVELTATTASYLSGPLTLSGTINLQIDSGAELQMLPYYSGTATTIPAGFYPMTNGSFAHFITIKSLSDVAITGQGIIDGQGAPWWTAYTANGALPSRPRLINVTGANRLLVAGISLTNSPSFHLAVSSNNLTVFGVTISAIASNALNTDGMDVSGSNQLIQSCNISDGDDDIVMKPGSAFCTETTIANCTIGAGHGLSIGGQSNIGLNGLLVTSCTFNGTSVGLRMKADPTEGGIVTNVTYSNLTMTNVTAPILFYSYYNEIGTVGGTSGSSLINPAIVNSWNGDSSTTTNSKGPVKTANAPINALNTTTLPAWENITINNLTATGASGYSTIWGLPLTPGYLISNVTLNNVKISGGSGLEIYDAANVQVTGTSSIVGYVTCNSLAITSQPTSQTVNSGNTATFTSATVGASGLTSTGPTDQWTFNGNALVNGTNSDGSVISGATTTSLTIKNVQSAEGGAYAMVASNSLDAYNSTTALLVSHVTPVSATRSSATLSIITPYDTYISSNGLSLASSGAPDATPANDGIPNIVKFVLGETPKTNNPGLLPQMTHSNSSGSPVADFTFDCNAANASSVNLTVQYSTDLSNWTTAINGQNGVSVSSTIIATGTDQIQVAVPAQSGPVFARLLISQ